jgi:anti-sigma-K factor RskA
MSDIDIHHLGAAYALDALDARERAAFEAHYHDCEICRNDVAQFRETLADVAAANPIGPPDSVKQRVMAEVARTRQLSPLLPDGVADLAERRRRRGRLSSALLAAAAALVVIAGSAIVVSRDSQPAYAKELADVLSQPDGKIIALDETGAGDADGTFKVAWSSSEARLVVLGDGLDQAPPGRAYELWLIDGSGAHATHVLDSAADGDVRAAIDLSGEPTAWGITIEPEQGSPAPTGDVIFLAEVQL